MEVQSLGARILLAALVEKPTSLIKDILGPAFLSIGLFFGNVDLKVC